MHQTPLQARFYFLQRDDDAQQHDSLCDTDSDAVEDAISSPPEYSEREARLVDLFKSQMSPALMKK